MHIRCCGLAGKYIEIINKFGKELKKKNKKQKIKPQLKK
jgi:hypothetical protein